MIRDSVNSRQSKLNWQVLLNYFVAAKSERGMKMESKKSRNQLKIHHKSTATKKNPFIVPPAPTSINQYLLNNLCKYDFSYISYISHFFRVQPGTARCKRFNLFPSSGRFNEAKNCSTVFFSRHATSFSALRIMM